MLGGSVTGPIAPCAASSYAPSARLRCRPLSARYWNQLPSSLNSAQSHSCIENRSDACKIRAAVQSAPVQAAQAQLERKNSQPTGDQSSAYAVSGVVLGEAVQFDSSALKEYKCTPSDQFKGFTWCQKINQEKERRGKFISTYSILHSRDGVAVYIDRYLEPAFFGAREAADDIRQHSRNIGETPRITRIPQRDGFPNGILASWGKVELDPLDNIA
jgi:hypothetical protein